MLVPNGSSGEASRSISERTKYPRLHGADLYVARLGWRAPLNSRTPNECCAAVDIPEDSTCSLPLSSTGSLYDELTTHSKSHRHEEAAPVEVAEKEPSVLSSRPCYRFINYMNSVGIKRVFFLTTNSGEWEGAKTLDLMDAIDNVATGESFKGATALSQVFVTKHEVLILRRLMGEP